MKSLTLFLFCSLFSLGLLAQGTYYNEWIDYDRTYYKIKVDKDGLYRINQNTLVNAGLPTEGIGYQLHYQGQEIPIYVSTDGPMGSNDYIEFYGKRNDGSFDTQLYQRSEWQPIPSRSLFSDEATYYLSWDNSTPPLRFTPTPNTISNPPAKEEFFMATVIREPFNVFFSGRPERIASTRIDFADFQEGEGFAGSLIPDGRDQDFSILTPSIYTNTTTPAVIETKVMGDGDDFTVRLDHHLQISLDGTVFIDTLTADYSLMQYEFEVPNNMLRDTTKINYASVRTNNSSSNTHHIAYAQITYPHHFDFQNSTQKTFTIRNDGRKYIEINNFDGGNQAVLYDLTHHLRIEPVLDNGIYKILLDPQATEINRELLLVNTNTEVVNTIAELTPIQFTDFSQVNQQGNYLLITHPQLRAGEVDYVQEYANYRNSIEGGGFQCVVANITELYDQFAWGIAQHPLAIRHFVDFAANEWGITPEYLFLIGKSVRYDKIRLALEADKAVSLVPTYGDVSSDIMLSSYNVFTYRHRLATGRLPARNPEHVRIYLDKAKAYDAHRNQPSCDRADRLWLKDALHFAGGSNLAESAEFLAALNQYEQIYEGDALGGRVIATLNKQSDNVIGDTDIGPFINQGLAMINYVGHSAGQFAADGLKNPTEYNNTDRYPFVFTSSCFVGDVHALTDPESASGLALPELYILTEKLGSIGFLASSSVGFPSLLEDYTSSVYHNFCQNNYGQSMAACIRESTVELEDNAANQNNTQKMGTRFTTQSYTLSGDPAIVINAWQAPDFVIEDNEQYADVTFEPQLVTADLDSFALEIVLTNLGQALPDSVLIQVERTLPNGENSVVVQQQYPIPNYIDTLTLYLQTGESSVVSGDNIFTIKVDPNNVYAEDCEDNNTVTKTLQIFSDLLIPIAPCNFGIVTTPQVTLSASTGQPLLAAKEYFLQLDTTAQFNSPLLQEQFIFSPSGVLDWSPSIDLLDNVVYYWRAASLPENGSNEFKWSESSFIYLPNSSGGWNQSHYEQFVQDDFDDILLNNNTRQFEYPSQDNIIQATTANGNNNAISYFLNGELLNESTCLTTIGVDTIVQDCDGGVAVAVFAPNLTLTPWKSERINGGVFGCDGRGTYGNVHCSLSEKTVFEFFTADEEQLQALVNFLTNEIPDGHYVLAYSTDNHRMENDPTNTHLPAIYQFFTDMGVPQFSNISNEEKFIVFGRKNRADYPATVNIATTSGATPISAEITVNTQSVQGRIFSPPIGPSLQYTDLNWDFSSLDGTTAIDDLKINVYGLSNTGDVLLTTSTNPNESFDLSFINAETYPFIRLEAVTTDSTNFTPPQLQFWRVQHQVAPEIAMNQQAGLSFTDSLQQGQNLELSLAISNVGETASDSVLVQYSITNNAGVNTVVQSSYAPPMAAGNTQQLTFSYSTAALSGTNTLVITLNPAEEQAEKFSFNNVILLPFQITKDNINPIVDVTFDGRHILDGELVSSKPNIAIKIKDENTFLALNDTSDITLTLLYPDATGLPAIPQNIDFKDANVQFTPATNVTSSDNVASIDFNPNFTQNGVYELMVTATDRTGNKFATDEYRIRFEIINESLVSNVLNYPNPFSTNTQFVFTLTGSEIPQFFKIQIMTVSGRVVREITQEELGSIHIGQNVTEFKWDGSDEFGDPLANGVYLYRVVTRLDGQQLNSYDVGTDQYFKKGIGKMYIMR